MKRKIDTIAVGADWRTVLSSDEVHILQDLSGNLNLALALVPSEEEGVADEEDFHSLWIGMLLGSGECAAFDTAYHWASFVRYHAQDLTS
jgi:hypothetical protein